MDLLDQRTNTPSYWSWKTPAKTPNHANAQAWQLRFFISHHIHKYVPTWHYFIFNKMGVYPLTLLISLSCMTTLLISWTHQTNLDGFPCFHPGSDESNWLSMERERWQRCLDAGGSTATVLVLLCWLLAEFWPTLHPTIRTYLYFYMFQPRITNFYVILWHLGLKDSP